MHRPAIHGDQLAQEVDGKHRLAPTLLLHDDLREDIVGDVLLGLGVHDLEVPPRARHRRQMLQRDVGRGLGVIEPSIGVFLDDGDAVAGTLLLHRVPFGVMSRA
jgi:hypothetical protein